MIGNAYSKSPLSSSRLTEIRKNKMLYADYISKTQGNNQGCDTARTGLENGKVAPGSIMPQLFDGATNTTVEEQASILQNTGCNIPVESGTIVFTNIGTASWTAPAGVLQVQYLVVAAGGGSGGGYDTGAGAGGGGGMVLLGTLGVIPGTTYTVVVGDGGAAGISNREALPETPGQKGDNSVFGSVTAIGGGGGRASRQSPNDGNGGAAAINPTSGSLGGNGGGSNGGGGGGGGSFGAGGNKSGSTGGAAGSGTESSFSGSSVLYGIGGAGGTGSINNAGVAGTANTGNGARGGGGASGADENGAKGGSGIVILKY